MSLLIHEPIKFVPVKIGDRSIMVSVKTAEKIKDRRIALKERDDLTGRELRESMMLPKNHGSNSRHASFVAEAYTTRNRKVESETVVRAYKTARDMGLSQEWGELCRKVSYNK